MAKKIKTPDVNKRHIEFYDKILSLLDFILEGYSYELRNANIDFLEMSKNSIAVLDFLISSVTKVQKGQRLALGLHDKVLEDNSPQINIIEGISENKI